MNARLSQCCSQRQVLDSSSSILRTLLQQASSHPAARKCGGPGSDGGSRVGRRSSERACADFPHMPSHIDMFSVMRHSHYGAIHIAPISNSPRPRLHTAAFASGISPAKPSRKEAAYRFRTKIPGVSEQAHRRSRLLPHSCNAGSDAEQKRTKRALPCTGRFLTRMSTYLPFAFIA